MTRQVVEVATKLKVDLVDDPHQDLNRELLQKISKELNMEYPEIKFEVETPKENNANSYLNTVNQLIASGAQLIYNKFKSIKMIHNMFTDITLN